MDKCQLLVNMGNGLKPPDVSVTAGVVVRHFARVFVKAAGYEQACSAG